MQLYANPYDMDATGFYFSTLEEYNAKAKVNFNRYGQFVEEYMIDSIDGTLLELELASAIGLAQYNFAAYLEACDEWSDDEITRACVVFSENITNECFTKYDRTDGDDIILHHCESFTELAEQMVDDGCYGDIPDHLAGYIDYQAIGRDLRDNGMSKVEVGNSTYIYEAQ